MRPWWSTLALVACFDAPPRPAPVDVDTSADARDASDDAEVDTATPDPAVRVALAVGREHACALVDGYGWCWGEGGDGRLGDGSATPGIRSPLSIATRVASLVIGSRHTCLATPAAASCFGDNRRAQIAASGSPAWSPVEMPARSLVAGYDATCLVADGVLACRGEPLDGSARTPTNDDDVEAGPTWLAPRDIRGVEGLRAPDDDDPPVVALGVAFGCAIVAGEVRCWGANAHDALGRGTTLQADPDAAGTAPLPFEAIEVAAGSTFACARGTGGAVACWGDNRRFQAGADIGASRPTPGAIPLPSPATRLALGRRHACALLDDHRLACWGDNTHGALGVADTSATARPVLVPLDDVVAVAAGWSSTCAARADGAVLCWGDDRRGQLGRGVAGSDFVATPTPVALDAPEVATCEGCPDVEALAAGDDHTCARVGAGTSTIVWCWGRGGDGRLGRGAFDVAIGRPFPTGSGETSVLAPGATTTCGLEAQGRVWCTGGGVATPETLALDPAVALAAHADRACAITAAGTLWCWGPERAPSELAKDLDPDDPLLAVGVDATCARAADGAIVCLGDNTRGQLGRGTLGDAPGIAPVLDLPAPSALAGAGRRFCALAEGVAWCWGANDRAALGLPTTLDHAPTPTPLSLPSPVTAIALGASSSCAVAAGEVFCWGDNGTAQLGLSPDLAVTVRAHRVRLSFPASRVTLGRGHACAASASGHLACWGDDAFGQLGGGLAGPSEPVPRALVLPGP